MAFPALAALTVYPASVQSHFGITGTLSGLLINTITPVVEATVTETDDEDTNPAVMIVSNQRLSYDVEAMRKSRTADWALYNPGVQITEAAVTWFAAGLAQNHPVGASGAYFVFLDPKIGAKKAELDSYSFRLKRWGYTLSRFAA